MPIGGNPKHWLKGGFYNSRTGEYQSNSNIDYMYDNTYESDVAVSQEIGWTRQAWRGAVSGPLRPILRPTTSSKLNLLDLPSDVLVKILVELFANAGTFIFDVNRTIQALFEDDLFWKAVCAKMRWDRKDRVTGPHLMKELGEVVEFVLPDDPPVMADDKEMHHTLQMFRSPYKYHPDRMSRRVTRPWFEQFWKWRRLQITRRVGLRIAVLQYLDGIGSGSNLPRSLYEEYGDYVQPFQCSQGLWPYTRKGPDGQLESYSPLKNADGLIDLPCWYERGPIETWDVSRVKNFAGVFAHCFEFNADISQWDVSSARSMYRMFERCYRFNANITGWDLTKLENYQFMFKDAARFLPTSAPPFLR